MPLEGARPHVSDLQPPDLIETMRADAQGVVALLSGHLRRLEQSAHTLGHVWPGQLAVESAIQASVAALATPRPQHLRLRLLMGAQGQLHVEVFPLPAITGVPAIAVTTRTLDSRERLLQHKTVHRPWYASTTAWLASHPDFFDLFVGASVVRNTHIVDADFGIAGNFGGHFGFKSRLGRPFFGIR